MVKYLPAMQETWIQSLSWEDPLEEGMEIHTSILAIQCHWHQIVLKPGCVFRSKKISRDQGASLVLELLFRTLRFLNRSRDAKTEQTPQQLLEKETAGRMKNPQSVVEVFVQP